MEQRIGIIMNGITGRMGLNQHLIRSVLAIRDDGGSYHHFNWFQDTYLYTLISIECKF